MAGGSLYQHHSGTLLAFYRFEEPFAVTLSGSHTTVVEDSSGNDYYGVITSGSLPSSPTWSTGDPTPIRTALTSPYNFVNPLPSGDVLGGPDKILAIAPSKTNQVRVIDFQSGSSERVELPRQLARDISSIPGRPFPHRETYESGMTFAGWIKMHPVTGSYSIDAQAKASAQLYLKPDSRSDLHGETLAISDSDGRTVVFTLDQNTAANVRNSPTDYTIGIGAYSSYMNGQNHAAAVYSGIKLAYDMGDLGVRPSNDGTCLLYTSDAADE